MNVNLASSPSPPPFVLFCGTMRQYGQIPNLGKLRDVSQLHPLHPPHTWQRSPKEGNSAYLGYSHPYLLPPVHTSKFFSCERDGHLSAEPGLGPSWGSGIPMELCDSNGAQIIAVMEARQGGRSAASQECHCSLLPLLGICCMFSC